MSYCKETVKMKRKRSLRKRMGHTLLEAMLASFLALICALIFSATIPISNVTRGKAETMNNAVSLAQKSAELFRGRGYPNVSATRLHQEGLIDSLTQVDLKTIGITSDSEMAYEATSVDEDLVDSPSRVLPNGRGFITTEQVDLDLRRVTVIMAWQEKSTWKSVRVSTLVANL